MTIQDTEINMEQADAIRINTLLNCLVEITVKPKTIHTLETKLNILDALFTIAKKGMTPEQILDHEKTYLDLLQELKKLREGQAHTQVQHKSRTWEKQLRQVIFDKKTKHKFFPE